MLNIDYRKPLTEEFIEANKDLVDWQSIVEHQKLSEGFIEKHKNLVNWLYISWCQKLSEEFIEKHKGLVNWSGISKYQKLSENFIEKHKGLVDWDWISTYQKLSEPFMERNKDLVNWRCASGYQKLSEEFIKRNKFFACYGSIIKYQKLSKECRNTIQYEECVGYYQINTWLYADSETKLKAVRGTGLYEIEYDGSGAFVIAYKGIRSDNYSGYNFQYQYFPGNEYESHADFNLDNEASFGLSAWTLKGARSYCSQKIIKVRIHPDDLAALVHEGNKIRCTKFYVIEEVV